MKKNIILLFFLLVCNVAFAQNPAGGVDNIFAIRDFSKMLNSHASEYVMPEGGAKQALNVRPNETYGALAKRAKMFLLSTAPTAAVKSLFRYYKSDDTQYTIATYSTYVSYISDTGEETKLYASASEAKRWSFLTYKDKLIGMNGTDNAKKWDSRTLTTDNTDAARTENDLMADLGAPFAELNTGSNLDASSWYQYKIAFYDGSAYYYSNARSNPLLTGASVMNIRLTDIPLGPSGTTQRIIYRTVGHSSRANVVASTTFYKVATISDNSTTTYDDAIADNTIDDDAAPTWSTVSAGVEVTPPKSKYCVISNERLFMANDPSGVESGKSTVYWSDLLNPDYFYIGTDYELIRADDGDEITFIKNLLGILTIGKTKTISKFYTQDSDTDNWYVSDPFSFIGCIAPYSAVNIDAGIAYLGRYGIYVYNGQYSTLVSDDVTDKTSDILSTSAEESVGAYHNNRYLLAYTSSESGLSVNDKVLILDLTINAFYMDTISVDSFATFESGDDFGTLYSGSSGSDGNIYAHKNEYNKVLYRYKSQLQGGTTDSIYVGGEEEDAYLSLGDDETWAESTNNWEDSGSATWLVEDLTGEWYSPIIQVNASALDKLYWNEYLASTGNVTFAVRTGATEAAVQSASWSSEYSDPSGSDISALTANVYLQIRASLSSSLYTETPLVFLSDYFIIKLTYKKEGTSGETSIASLWESGYTNFQSGENPKRIKEVNIFYAGSEGTMNVEVDNDEGDSWDFDIDLSVNPATSSQDAYYGTNTEKIYTFIPPFDDTPQGRWFKFKITESGTEQWTVKKIQTRFDINSYTTFK